MNKFENEKRCQTYEVTDFQHNFEIDRPVTVAQQWGLHIHSTHYEVIVFIRGNVDFWIEGRRKKLEYGDIVIVNPREIHRTFLQDDSEYERILIHVSDSMLKDLSTAQTNLLSVFHKNKAHILHFSENDMNRFVHDRPYADEKSVEEKGIWSRSFMFCMVSDFADSDFAANAYGGRIW